MGACISTDRLEGTLQITNIGLESISSAVKGINTKMSKVQTELGSINQKLSHLPLLEEHVKAIHQNVQVSSLRNELGAGKIAPNQYQNMRNPQKPTTSG